MFLQPHVYFRLSRTIECGKSKASYAPANYAPQYTHIPLCAALSYPYVPTTRIPYITSRTYLPFLRYNIIHRKPEDSEHNVRSKNVIYPSSNTARRVETIASAARRMLTTQAKVLIAWSRGQGDEGRGLPFAKSTSWSRQFVAETRAHNSPLFL